MLVFGGGFGGRFTNRPYEKRKPNVGEASAGARKRPTVMYQRKCRGGAVPLPKRNEIVFVGIETAALFLQQLRRNNL